MEERAEAARHLASDLKALRDKKGLSLTDIHTATRATIEQIQQFESTGLISVTTQINPVYYRAFLQSYARELGLRNEEIKAVANQVMGGTYDGYVGVQYVRKQEAKQEQPTKMSSEFDESVRAQKESLEKENKKHTPSKLAKTEDHSSNHNEEEDNKSSTEITSPSKDSVENGKQPTIAASNKAIHNNGAAIGAIVFVSVIFIAVAALVWWRFQTAQDPVAPNELIQEVAPEDTISIQPAPPIVLPDSILVALTADEPVMRIKIRTDVSSETWHWIDVADTVRFTFVDSISVRHDTETNGFSSQLPKLTILVQDQELPVYREEQPYRYVLTRNEVCIIVGCDLIRR